MKKFLSILVLFLAMFMFVACGKEENDDKNNGVINPNDVVFEVNKEEVNKEVKLTETGKQSLSAALVAIGCPENEVSANVEMLVPMIEMARLSDEKVVEIASIVTENKDLLEKLMELVDGKEKEEELYPMSAPQQEESALPITADEIKQAVKAVKDLLNAIGDDTLGLFLYNYTELLKTQGAQAMPFEISLEVYVAESRMIMAILKSVVASISDADIDEVYSMMSGPQTDEAMARLVAIVKDTVNAINFDDSVWEKYFAVVNSEMKKVFSDPTFVAMIEGLLAEEGANKMASLVLEATLEMYEQVGKLTPAMIQYMVNVLDEVDAEFIGLTGTDTYVQWDKDYINGTESAKYYIDGKEVTEEAYNEQIGKMNKAGAELFYNAYKKLDKKDQDSVLESIESYIVTLEEATVKLFKQEMPDENMENYKYKGEAATLDEVFAELDKVIAKDVITEDDFMPVLEKLLGYAGSKAPLLVGTLMQE